MTQQQIGVCRHCGEKIMKFQFTEGEQWWHANPAGTPRRTPAPAYRRCYADPTQPFAAP